MNVTINIVELASELANAELETSWIDSINIWIENGNGDLTYSKEAQDVFNDLYDKYYNLIDLLKIN